MHQWTAPRAGVVAAALILLLAGPARAQQKLGDDPSKTLADLVDTAIEKGVSWLKKRQQPEGHFGRTVGQTYAGTNNAYPNLVGNTAFALYTLLKCGVPKNDPVIVKGFAYIRKNYGLQIRSTYEIAACLFAYEALSTHKPKRKRGEKEFEYKKRAAKKARVVVGRGDRSFVKQLITDLVGVMNYEPGVPVTGLEGKGWRYGNTLYAQAKAQAQAQGGGTINGFQFSNTGGNMDISATQYALLGLKSASRMGYIADIHKVYAARPDSKRGDNIFFDVMRFLMSQQEKDGPVVAPVNTSKDPRRTFVPTGTDKARGWAYMRWYTRNPQESTTSGSMTTAGVCGMLLCKSELMRYAPFARNKKLVKKARQSIRDGIAWLSKNYTMERNPYVSSGAGPGGPNPGMMIKGNHYYYLYGMERMGVFGDIDKIDTHDWYQDGAAILLGQQKQANKEDWFWDSGQTHSPGDEYDTCFALLFLEKASVPMPGGAEITHAGK